MISWGAFAHSKVLQNGEMIFNCMPTNPDVHLKLVAKNKATVDEIAEAELNIADQTGVFPLPVDIYKANLNIETSFVFENYNYEIINENGKVGEFQIAIKNKQFCGRASCVISQDFSNNQALLKIYEKEIPFTCN
ncbi:MAG: hypothetical protein H7256_07265 [Bdellovibrio sp.]|nr:hypothetical protein [Bdellovibrio sp.]